MANFIEHWQKQFDDVPEIKQDAGIDALDKHERLDRFNNILTIDNIVRRSAGAYTHDEIYFDMKANFVMTLTLMYYEQDMLAQRRSYFAKVFREQKKT